MALPPEPLQDLLERAERVVVATVGSVVASGIPTPDADHGDDWSGPIDDDPWQVVRLDVERSLLGTSAARVDVYKPSAPYLLSAGQRGVFLLAPARGGRPAPWVVLGRYGPESYGADEVLTAVEAGRVRDGGAGPSSDGGSRP